MKMVLEFTFLSEFYLMWVNIKKNIILLTLGDNSKESLIICYVSFGTINFLCFVSYFAPFLRVTEWCVEADV
jgi:hypothetical protein